MASGCLPPRARAPRRSFGFSIESSAIQIDRDGGRRVEIRVIGRLAVATAATVVLSVVAVSTQAPAQPAGQTPAPGGGGGRGRGRQAGPPEPTPHLADGTVNLGRVPGEKGIW